LQIQAPENGSIKEPKDLIGKNVVTSFTNLTEAYFRKLEADQDGEANGTGERKLRTNVKYVGGSVEAACALGVADGIVDLVGECMKHTGKCELESSLTILQNRARQCVQPASRRYPRSWTRVPGLLAQRSLLILNSWSASRPAYRVSLVSL